MATLREANLRWAGNFQGCTPDEVALLERRHGVRLPLQYRAFLGTLGRSARRFLVGSDFLYDQLDGMQPAARELVEDEGGDPLPANAFAFAMHQGYQFLFFICDSNPDPAVYRFLEGEGTRHMAESFTAWFGRAVRDETSA